MGFQELRREKTEENRIKEWEENFKKYGPPPGYAPQPSYGPPPGHYAPHYYAAPPMPGAHYPHQPPPSQSQQPYSRGHPAGGPGSAPHFQPNQMQTPPNQNYQQNTNIQNNNQPSVQPVHGQNPNQGSQPPMPG